MDIKQAIVVRHDLKMRRGKQIAQASHAAMAFLLDKLDLQFYYATGSTVYSIGLHINEIAWILKGQTKICLRVDSEQELLEIRDKAEEAGLAVHVITDAGKTEFHGVPTITCLAIGPAESSEIDKITGQLKLM